MSYEFEIELLSRLRNDDVHAFDSLFHSYSKRLYLFAFSILKNKEDSEGIVQEVFIRVWNNRRSIDVTRSFKSYLFTISHNLIIDKLRKKIKENEILGNFAGNNSINTNTVENEVDFNIINSAIDKIVKELPEKRKKIYELSRIKGMSHKEISEHLNISVKTVENQINLALKHLKERLGSMPFIVLLFPFLLLV